MLTITSNRHVRVLYELEFYSTNGEFLGCRFITRKRLATQIMNIWKKHGFEVSMRKMNPSEWHWVNSNDIESEVK